MDNYIPSEIEGLIAATSKLKDALVSVQNDLASQVIGKCFVLTQELEHLFQPD